MKKLFTLIAALLLAATVWAQSSSPKMSYQAVVRNAANELVVNRTDLTVEITIKQADTVAFKETHTEVKTNQNGLLSLLIGEGNVINGSLSDVDWTKAIIGTKISVPGNGDVTATAPVTAVPLSMYAYDVDSSSTIIKNIKKEFKDTLSNYFDTAQINNTFKYYLTIDGLCDSIKSKCGDFATKTELKEAVDTLVSKPTLANYYLKTETYSQSEVNEKFENYYTKEKINDTLANYYTQKEINDTLNNYYTKKEINDTLNNYYTKKEINDTLKSYLTIDGLCDSIKSKCGDFATKTELKEAVDTLVSKPTLANYYLKTETYSQSEVNEKFENYYTKEKINDTLAKYSLLDKETSLTIKSLAKADSIKLMNDTTLSIPTGFTNIHTDRLIKLYINGVYVGDNEDGVIVVTGKKVHYDASKNDGYELTLGDRIKIVYWVKKN